MDNTVALQKNVLDYSVSVMGNNFIRYRPVSLYQYCQDVINKDPLEMDQEILDIIILFS